ncbi:long-chain fatty acid--CoA ligase [Myxococcota bacterium]|nr:long-chain fatty acid--CoA ligase [Myxococcota bacterium]
MDVTPFLEIKIAPKAIFESLSERRDRARFMLPTPDGGWRPVTWGDVARQIETIALFLSAAGLQQGDRGAVFAPNRVEWMSAALAIQAAGGVIVPVYPASTPDQAAYIVDHSDAKFLFVDTPALVGRILDAWPAYARVERIVVLDDGLDLAKVRADLVAKHPEKDYPSFEELEKKFISWSMATKLGAERAKELPGELQRLMDSVPLDQPGMMLYTSGTSGNPKGVPLTHDMVGVNGRDWINCNGSLIDEDAVDLMWLPMSHIFGFGEACLGNALGFTTYLVDPLTVMNRLPEVKPNVFMSVPSLWEKIATMSADPDPAKQKEKLHAITGGRMRFCLSGGAGLKREVKEHFHHHGILIIEGYGLTECSPTLTLNRPDAFRFDTVGKPLPSVEVKLAEDGEILAKGPNVFKGYHKDEAATKECFTEDGWFKTGDLGLFTEDGFLRIIDRKKDILVTSGGKNVAPANIELKFQNDPLIAHVVVYGDAKKYLVAGVWPNAAMVKHVLDQRGVPEAERASATRQLVQERVDKANAELASYETIKRFAIFDSPLTVEGGLLTSTLKVRRKKVYEAFRDTLEALYS